MHRPRRHITIAAYALPYGWRSTDTRTEERDSLFSRSTSTRPPAVVLVDDKAFAALNAATRTRLGHGRVAATPPVQNGLHRVLAALDQSAPQAGLAALRLLGQTGKRHEGWLAAADPVCLAAKMDHLTVQSTDERDEAAIRDGFKLLTEKLGRDDGYEFCYHVPYGYLKGREIPGVPNASPRLVMGLEPSEFLPPARSAPSFHRLSSEIQMVLHDWGESRQVACRAPLNALWLWGGGHIPATTERMPPPLLSVDPVLRGFWLLHGGVVADGDTTLPALLADHGRGVVMSLAGADLEAAFDAISSAQSRRQVGTAVFLFADGIEVSLAWSDRFRFWRSYRDFTAREAGR